MGVDTDTDTADSELQHPVDYSENSRIVELQTSSSELQWK